VQGIIAGGIKKPRGWMLPCDNKETPMGTKARIITAFPLQRLTPLIQSGEWFRLNLRK
jgi:hypothetical protein